MTVIDISSTIREVVMKLLYDRSVDRNVLKKRADAVFELGVIWEGLKKKSTDGTRKK